MAKGNFAGRLHGRGVQSRMFEVGSAAGIVPDLKSKTERDAELKSNFGKLSDASLGSFYFLLVSVPILMA